MQKKYIKTCFWFLLSTIGIISIVPSIVFADSNEPISINIPAQALDQAVTSLATQAGIVIGGNAELLRGKNSPEVQGEYTPEEALRLLLSGSGVGYTFVDANTVTLEKLPEQLTDTVEDLPPITVTGELIARDIQDTQTSVAVITGEELETREDVDLYDVIERTPGVISAFGDKGFSIRGIDQRGVGGGGTGLTVSTTVDGAIISSSNQLTFFGPYSTWDLEQVEILRGPQSTQTGRNALAGAVVIKSKDPVYRNESKVRLEGAENDGYGAAFAFNTPLIEDKLALRISGESRETDGFIRNPTRGTDRYDARNQDTYRFALRFDPTDKLDAIFKFTYAENFGGEDFVNFDDYPDSRLNFSDLRAVEGSRLDSYNLRLGYDINSKLRLESETTYFDAEYVRIEDSDNSPTPNNFLTRTSDVYNFQQEFKLLFEHQKWTGVIGAFFLNVTDDAPASGIVDAGLFAPPFAGLGTINAIIDTRQNTENYALFGEVEYQLTPKWKLIAGARYDDEEIEITNTNAFTTDIAALAPSLPTSSVETLDSDFDEFLPKAGIVYDFTDDVSLGFTIQRGYRAGGSSTRLLTGERREFDPEYTWNYETAFRSKWMDNKLTFNANMFYTEWEDQQVSIILSANPNDTITENAGESTTYGGEIEMQATPTDNWDLFASLAYVDTEFDEFESSNGDFSGNEFPFAPDLTLALGATHYFNNGVYASADLSYTEEYYSDSANTSLLEADNRTLVNLRVGYEGNDWNVFAYAKNLFDEDYYTQAVDSGMGTIGLVRSGEPRIVGIVANIDL